MGWSKTVVSSPDRSDINNLEQRLTVSVSTGAYVRVAWKNKDPKRTDGLLNKEELIELIDALLQAGEYVYGGER